MLEPDCEDVDCEALRIARSVYTVIDPTHDHAHYMNSNPCWECNHGLRYHQGGECMIPDCGCAG